jgi:hypothetical protein
MSLGIDALGKGVVNAATIAQDMERQKLQEKRADEELQIRKAQEEREATRFQNTQEDREKKIADASYEDMLRNDALKAKGLLSQAEGEVQTGPGEVDFQAAKARNSARRTALEKEANLMNYFAKKAGSPTLFTADMLEQERQNKMRASEQAEMDAEAKAAKDETLFNLNVQGKQASIGKTLADTKLTNKKLDELEKQIEKANLPKNPSGQINEGNRQIWQSLSDRYRKDIGGYKEALGEVEKVKLMINQATGAGDIAGIFSFMKSLDPRSTVRESEFQLPGSAGGLYDKILGALSNAQGEGRLGPETRKQLLDAVGSLGGMYQANVNRVDARYTDLSKRAMLDPVLIIDSGSQQDQAGQFESMSETDLDEQLRKRGIDPATGQPLKVAGGASGSF